MGREMQAMRNNFLEEFQSADNARSIALQRAFKGHSRYNFSHFYSPRYNQFYIRLHNYTTCVYSMGREMQTMRINFLEEFQSADNARSIALQRAHTGHSKYNLSHFYSPRYNPV